MLIKSFDYAQESLAEPWTKQLAQPSPSVL